MTITIRIKTDNDAFSDDKHAEVHRIVADWINNKIAPVRQVGPKTLYDYNGNAVGTVTVTGR